MTAAPPPRQIGAAGFRAHGSRFGFTVHVRGCAFRVPGSACRIPDPGKTEVPDTNMVDQELLEILACPKCKIKVDLVKDGTALKCPQCRRVYPIKDDIPVMLIDEATIEP
jgi:hypothetical protein